MPTWVATDSTQVKHVYCYSTDPEDMWTPGTEKRNEVAAGPLEDAGFSLAVKAGDGGLRLVVERGASAHWDWRKTDFFERLGEAVLRPQAR